ncbi:MAG: sulfite exporter TauE/SafE family protein [Pirellulales bacterium]|nr:sulfite exporter TauE/SafE family protein [Pirellulales bacterium]
MEYLIQGAVGLLAGLLGGLLGLGGSTVIIPALIFYLSQTGGYTGPTQHLLQAAAMICNVFIAAPSTLAHLRAGAVMKWLLVFLVPAALVGNVLGVWISNCSVFARENGPYLAIVLAGFFAFVAVYNLVEFAIESSRGRRPADAPDDPAPKVAVWKVLAVALPTGLTAGLLGIGGGTVCVPAQQILLRIPLRRAIANSAVVIVFVATAGAIYKNATLWQHGASVRQSLGLAAMLIPTAMIGSYIGGRLTHVLPRRALRVVFVLFMLSVAYLTFTKAWDALDARAGATPSPLPLAGEGRILDCPSGRDSGTGLIGASPL